MKRLWVFITACLLLFSSATAETVTTQEFTADEQAYNVYLDISTGYSEGVKYLEEIEYLWRQAIELGDVEKADSVWFNAMIAAGGGELDITHMMRYQQLAQLKYGYADYTGLYDHFTATLERQNSNEASSIVRAALPLSVESGYVQSAESLEKYLDEAKAGIRTLMKMDPDYSFTEDLQNYYKELNLLLKYIQDFNASYSDFKAKTESFVEKLISFEVDFEFIFDPDDYEKVIEVRSDKRKAENKVTYDQAVALENAGEYSKAIELYWQCSSYMDSSERMLACHKRLKDTQNAETEAAYQKALTFLEAENYSEAVALLKSVDPYKDSTEKIALCEVYIKSENATYQALKGFNGHMLAPVMKNNKWGFIDRTGKLIVPCIYDFAGEFYEGLASVGINKDPMEYGYIDETGDVVIPINLNYSGNFFQGRAITTKREGFIETSGYIDRTGNVVIPIQFATASNFDEAGLAVVSKNGKFGCINTSGEFVIPATYDAMAYCASDLYAAKQNDKYGLINSKGETIVPFKMNYTNIYGYGNEDILLAGKQKSKYETAWGFIDATGKELHSCNLEYYYIGEFNDERAAVLGGAPEYNYGYINQKGTEVIPCKYQGAKDFADGFAIVQFGEAIINGDVNYPHGVIDTDGREIIPCEYLGIAYEDGVFYLMTENEIQILPREEIQLPR